MRRERVFTAIAVASIIILSAASVSLYGELKGTQEQLTKATGQLQATGASLRAMEGKLEKFSKELATTKDLFQQDLEKKASESRIALQTVESRLDKGLADLKGDVGAFRDVVAGEQSQTNTRLGAVETLSSKTGEGLVKLADVTVKLAEAVDQQLASTNSKVSGIQQRLEDFGEIQREVHRNRLDNKERAQSTARWALREFDERMAGYEWAAQEGIWFGIDRQLDFLKYLALNVNNGVTEDEFLEGARRLSKYLKGASRSANFSVEDVKRWVTTILEIVATVYPKG